MLKIIDARVLTMNASDTDPLGVIPRADVAIRGGQIESVTPHDPEATVGPGSGGGRVIDADGRVLLPAFIDAHTHALWAGDRLGEWELKRRGVPYLDILKAGGGIMSTVRAVRQASERSLFEELLERLRCMGREGTTTIEIKSGYGLDTTTELKMLRVIHRAAGELRGEGITIVPTALLGHALDPDAPPERLLATVIDETLPAVHEEFPGVTIDAFCEEGAWPLAACIRLFECAMALGHPFRVHTDQFNSLGMTDWAVAQGALSVDHLEASTPETHARIARSRSFAVLLPCAGFHTDGRYADGRAIIDAAAGSGDRVVIATNLNPGSAPCSSMPMAVALAVRKNGLGISEALRACTASAARLLGFKDRGRVSAGMRADLIILRHRDERQLAHEFGGDPVDAVVAGGALLKGGTR